MNIPDDIQKILDYLDKGMSFTEYCELIGMDENEVKLSIAEKVPRNTYHKIRKVYFEDDDEDHELIGALPYKLRKFTTGRYGLFKGDEFIRMMELSEGYIIYSPLYSGKYAEIFKKGGLNAIIDKVRDGWYVSEIAEYWGVPHGLLKKFIELKTGCKSMKEFQKKYKGDYIRWLK